MSTVTNSITAMLLAFLHLSSSAMVLPRPPSSPNHIHQDQGLANRKLYDGKSSQSLTQSASVEKPNTEDYRLLEIELQSPDEMDATNLQSLVHAVLKQSEEAHNESYPNPEVVPNSILGVRDMGYTPNFRMNTFDQDKRVLLSPPKLRDLDEKLYYLKNGRPKVYVNVRGHSGSFVKSSNPKTTPSEGIGYLRVTQPFQSPTDWKAQDRKTKAPKKYKPRSDSGESIGERTSSQISENIRMNGQASAYSLDDLSTTENSMVTSSELPKQIPAPPSRIPGRTLMAQTTPVQRYALRRTDILPGYAMSDD